MYTILIISVIIAFWLWAAHYSVKKEIREQMDGTDLYLLIEEMKFYKKTHDDWASYFEAHPDREKDYVETGEWNNAKEHRRVSGVYDRVILILEQLLPQRKAA